MLESFTDAARQAVVQAQVIAGEHGDHPATAAHLLLALAGQPGRTAQILDYHGVSAETVASRVPRPYGDPGDPALVLGDDLQWCLTRARVEATIARDHEITDRHLVLAAINEPGIRESMQQVGFDLNAIRGALHRSVG